MARKITTADFIAEASKVHNHRYDYSLTNYTKAHDKVAIICSDHGRFEQLAYSHVQGQGCHQCTHSKPLTESEFITRSRFRYGNKYTILKGSFTGNKKPLTIICRDHGQFSITMAETHLRNDGCCPDCVLIKRIENIKTGNTSRVETAWLDSLKILQRQHRDTIGSKTFIFDGFDPESGTVYECYGSYWHGNPEYYNPEDINSVLKVSFGELYRKTMQREDAIRTKFKLVTTWVK